MIEFYFLTFYFGAIIGSFLNVVILRLPESKSVVTPRSSCPVCHHMIPWYENIPIVSFLFLRGKCSQCKTKISWQYPLIELIVALAALYFIGFGYTGLSSLTFIFFKFSVFCLFLAHFIIDIKHYLLLDILNIYLAGLFLFYGFFYHSFIFMGLGAAIGAGIPYLVTWLFYKLRGKIGLGGGDIKLWGALGIYLGPLGIIHNIWLSCTLGALVGVLLIACKVISRDEPLPFGPFIIVVATVQIFKPDLIASILTNFLGF